MSQEDLARRTRTKKSAISRLENHAEDVRLSTIQRVARALGKCLRIELVGSRRGRVPPTVCYLDEWLRRRRLRLAQLKITSAAAPMPISAKVSGSGTSLMMR